METSPKKLRWLKIREERHEFDEEKENYEGCVCVL